MRRVPRAFRRRRGELRRALELRRRRRRRGPVTVAPARPPPLAMMPAGPAPTVGLTPLIAGTMFARSFSAQRIEAALIVENFEP